MTVIHVVVAMKPIEGNYAENAIEHGIAGLNIDDCRIASGGEHKRGSVTKQTTVSGDMRNGKALGMYGAGSTFIATDHDGGRFPANIIHDGSDEIKAEFPETGPSKATKRGLQSDIRGNKYNDADSLLPGSDTVRGHNDSGGSAARFFKECK